MPHLSFENTPTWRDRLEEQVEVVQDLGNKGIQWYKEQRLWKQIAIALVSVVLIIAGLLAVIFYHRVLDFAVGASQQWENTPGGKFIMFGLIFGVSFPPLIGFSALSTMTGMIWGFPHGWTLLASASIIGSTCSFLLFRYVLKERSRQMMETSKTFEAFTLVLNDKNALWLLALIRLCPLPYSLSNGALAAIPGIRLPVFIGASVFTSPKLLIPIFIGSRLKSIGEAKTGAERAIDLISILITVVAFSTATAVIYKKMQEKLSEIDNGLDVHLDLDGNIEIDDDNFLRDDDYEDDNLVV